MSSFCYSQDEDIIWMFGFTGNEILNPEQLLDTTWGITLFDFRSDPPQIYLDETQLVNFLGTNSSISNSEDGLKLYTNGQALWNGNSEYVEDTINYNQLWENRLEDYNGTPVPMGLSVIQGAIILPSPAGGSEYYVVYGQFDVESLDNYALSYSKFDLDPVLISPTIKKDISLKDNWFSSGCLNAVRHANGRDWWIFNSGEVDNKIYSFLLSESGVIEYSTDIGLSQNAGFGQLYLSPDGSKLGIQRNLDLNELDGAQIVIADFDRTTGEISNVK